MTTKDLYKTMLRIRLFEQRVGEEVTKGEVVCPCHLYIGQEAVATGICANLRKDDYVFSTHRSHGHYLAKGGDMRKLAAELYGKSTGCSKGHGGSMHLIAEDVGFMGSSAIVAGSIPLAVGTALASQMQGKDNVSVAFFGDGAVCEGVFYESLNFASLKKMPVIFACENNLYATHMPVSENLANMDIYSVARAFKMEGLRMFGNDVLQIYYTLRNIIKDIRENPRPYLIEFLTYRWCGHVGYNDDIGKGLRSREELDYWKEKCPIKSLEKELSVKTILTLRGDVQVEVKNAFRFAKENPYPQPSELMDGVF